MSEPTAHAPAVCPYCAFALAAMPQRKKRCPNCRQHIYVKSSPDNREKRLMTEDEAAEIDLKWSAEAIRNFYLRTLSYVRIGASALDEAIDNGAESVATAAFLLICNHIHRSPDWHGRRNGHFLLSEIAKRDGRSPLPHLVDIHRGDLMSLTGNWRTIAVRVQVLRAEGERQHAQEIERCDFLALRLYRIRDALIEMPLPCGEECVCRWEPVGYSDIVRSGEVGEVIAQPAPVPETAPAPASETAPEPTPASIPRADEPAPLMPAVFRSLRRSSQG